MMGLLLDIAEQRRAAVTDEVDDWAVFEDRTLPRLAGWRSDARFACLDRHVFADTTATIEVEGTTVPTVTDMSLRSPYMESCDPRRTRWTRDTEDYWGQIGDAMPFYHRGTPVEPVVLVDMTAAYWTIMQRMSTRAEYRAGTGSWCAVGEEWQAPAEVGRHKALYSSIASHAWRVKHPVMWRQGEPVESTGAQRHYQPQAWCLLCDILHAVAQEAVESWEAVRVIADGAWVPARRYRAYQAALRARWGLESHVEGFWAPGRPWYAREGGPKGHREVTEAASSIRPQARVVRDRLAAGLLDGAPAVPPPVTASLVPPVHYERPAAPRAAAWVLGPRQGAALLWEP
jgi:hypothetical protein